MEDPVNRHLEEGRRRILAIARIAFPQPPSDLGIRRTLRLCEEAARRLEVGNGLNVEDDHHGHGSIQCEREPCRSGTYDNIPAQGAGEDGVPILPSNLPVVSLSLINQLMASVRERWPVPRTALATARLSRPLVPKATTFESGCFAAA